MKDIKAEHGAMRAYLAGDCNCCEHSGDCGFFANLSFPEQTEDCHWEFSSALVREYARTTKEVAEVIPAC